jgi:hypothetical protein
MRRGPGEWTARSFGRQRRRRYEAGGCSRELPFSRFFTMLGGLTPRRCAHSARMRVEDFLCCDLWHGPDRFPLFLLSSVVYMPLRGGRTINETQSINQSIIGSSV